MGRALHIMTDQVTFAPQTGTDRSGDPSFGSQETIACRVEDKRNRVVSSEGEELISSHVIASETLIPLGSRVWLPDTDPSVDNDALEPMSLGRTSTPDGYAVFRTFL